MKRLKLSTLLLTLALVAGFCVVQPRLNAQQDQPTAQQPQPDSARQPVRQMSDSQTFVGKVAKSGGKFVLRDDTTKAIYMLDDQARAKKFDGQAVQVTGTLDPSTKTIHVSSIAPAS